MSSLGGICICGAGCKKETGCRGYGTRRHEMEATNSEASISGTAPLMNESMGTKMSSTGAEEEEEVPVGYKNVSCNQ